MRKHAGNIATGSDLQGHRRLLQLRWREQQQKVGAEAHSGTRLASTFVAADGAKPSPRPTSTRVAHSAKMPAGQEWWHTRGNVGWTRACSEPDASECDRAIAEATVPSRTHLCGGRRQQRAQAPDGHARHQHFGAAHPAAKDHQLTLGAFLTASKPSRGKRWRIEWQHALTWWKSIRLGFVSARSHRRTPARTSDVTTPRCSVAPQHRSEHSLLQAQNSQS